MSRLALALLLIGCGGTPEPAEPVAEPEAPDPEPPRTALDAAGLVAPATEAEEEALDAARAAAHTYASTLRERLQGAMAEGGPTHAVEVCAEVAPALAAQSGEAHGASVGRATDRPRNPEAAGPEAPVAWLAALRELPDDMVTPAEGILRREGEADLARVLRPIRTEPVCLACHGQPEAIAPEVQEVIAERYPTDQATGYDAGELRGVLWAEREVRP